jgi:hypothetical protein
LLNAPAGSYQFAIKIRKAPDLHLFEPDGPEVDDIVQKTVDILRAASREDEEALDKIVPDAAYSDVFLRLARDMAPAGTAYERLEVRSSAALAVTAVALTRETRQITNSKLRARKQSKTEDAQTGLVEKRLSGVLRGLHLDDDWLEVTLPGTPGHHVKVYEATAVIDDIVGPLVNRRVLVDVVVRTDGVHLFRDIQGSE